MNNIRLFAFFCIVSWQLKAMDAPILDRQELIDIHRIGQKILALCPPTSCLVIGVGQSPTPFIAYLQTKQSDYAFSVPLTNFRHGIHTDKLDGQDLKRLFTHFKQFFPSPNILGQRSVMLLDYVSTKGESILAASRYIEQYFRNIIATPPKVEITVLRTSTNEHLIPYRFNNILEINNNNKIATKLHDQFFDNYSAFGEFYIQDDDCYATTSTRAAYEHLKDLIRGQNTNLSYTNVTSSDFAFKTQSGTLDHDFFSAQKTGLTEWYINQLKYYEGNDIKDRFQATLADPEGKLCLIKYWHLFYLMPNQQKKILIEMLKIRDDAQLESIISNITAVAFSLKPLIIISLLDVVASSSSTRLELSVSRIGLDFIDVYLKLYQIAVYKDAADRMLDHYLMPEITLFEQPDATDNFAQWQTHIVSNFNNLLQEPELKNIVIEKFHSYRDEKLWLPKVIMRNHEETANIVTTPLHESLHKFYRALLLDRIEQLIKAWENN